MHTLLIILFYQIDPLIDSISKSGPDTVTGWGIALLISLTLNYFMYREFRNIQSRVLNHLDSITTILTKLNDTILSQSNHN